MPEWATRVLSSPRTLLRDFRAETGLTFEQWRLSCRLHAAVEHLSTGHGVATVAARVGFATHNGLTRAFRKQFGLTPHEFSRELSARRGANGLALRATAAHGADQLACMMRATGAPDVPDKLPAGSTPAHSNTVHVLTWTYCGSGYLDIGARRYEKGRGVATWIPAGVEHITGARENSLSLPLGNAATGDLQLSEPLQAQFPPAWDDYLLFCSVSSRTPLRPDGYQPSHILELFADQVAVQRALSVPMPIDARARGVAIEYVRSVGTSGGPRIDAPAGVRRAFREQTGMSFARWSYAARMRIARDLIAGGAKPSAVTRRVGYAHLPTFSAAFTRFHGLSPREHQERQAGNSWSPRRLRRASAEPSGDSHRRNRPESGRRRRLTVDSDHVAERDPEQLLHRARFVGIAPGSEGEGECGQAAVYERLSPNIDVGSGESLRDDGGEHLCPPFMLFNIARAQRGGA